MDEKKHVFDDINEDNLNPFVNDIFVLYERKYYREEKIYIIDEVKKVSLYKFRTRKEMILKLNPKSCQLILYIIACIADRSDVVYINRQRYIEGAGISAKTFERCMSEVIRKKIVAHYVGKRNTYWINPDYFYAGNRLIKYPDNITKI